MEKIFDKLMSMLDKMPVYMQLIGLLIISFMVMAYKIFSNEKVQKSIIARLQKKIGKLTESDLSLHRLFDRKEVYQAAINNIKFNSSNKSIVFRKILTSKLEVDIRMAREFLEKNDFSKIDKNTLCSMMITQVNCMVKTYEAKAMEELRMYFGNLIGQNLFDFVMNNPGGFREKRVDRLNRIIFQIDEYLRNSQIFDNNVERIEYFFTEIQYALRISILEAEKMFDKLNGEIDKIVLPND
ncbi:MAG: hypothetical protein P1P88_04705 [Bacteroidales bacterium]|nr:hypothetical protein [Bacteroidales bacterium]